MGPDFFAVTLMISFSQTALYLQLSSFYRRGSGNSKFPSQSFLEKEEDYSQREGHSILLCRVME